MNLECHSFFGPLSALARQRLVAAAAHQLRTAGVCVFEEGAPPDALYLVLSGEVEIRKRTPSGRTEVLARIQPNDCFGEMGVLDGGPRSAGAYTAVETRLARIPASALLEVLRSEPGEGVLQLFRRTSARLRTMDSEFLATAFRGDRLQVLREAVESLRRNAAAARLAARAADPAGAGVAVLDRMEAAMQCLAEYAAGRFELHRTAVAVDAFLAGVGAANEAYVRAHGVTFETRPCEGRMMVDPMRLGVALQHLINNAVEAFGGRGGRIRIEALWRPSHVELTVTDNGPGLPADVRTRLFTPFVSSGAGASLGLGLTLARAIVEAHGGTITCMTASGRGTTFVLTVPAG